MAPSIAGYTWHDAYNFAIVNPGQASGAILLAWPLFIALAAVAVVLSPLVFPGAMLASYVLKATNAPAMEKPKRKAVAAPGASYAEMYPEVQPKANLREFLPRYRKISPARAAVRPAAPSQSTSPPAPNEPIRSIGRFVRSDLRSSTPFSPSLRLSRSTRAEVR